MINNNNGNNNNNDSNNNNSNIDSNKLIIIIKDNTRPGQTLFKVVNKDTEAVSVPLMGTLNSV